MTLPRSPNELRVLDSQHPVGRRSGVPSRSRFQAVNLAWSEREQSVPPSRSCLCCWKQDKYRSRREMARCSPASISALLASTRETDVVGWYEDQRVLGVMFTDLVIYEKNSLLAPMLARVSNILRDNLTFEQFNQISYFISLLSRQLGR